ncbi:MAG: hypothetical protein ABFS34_08535 [Gemmatimonadota bacterium]
MMALLAVALVSAAGEAAPVQADDSIHVRGVVVAPSGDPVGGVELMLHRMSDEGAGLLASGAGQPDGSFAFAVDAPGGPAVHFVAASVGGALFVGPVVEAGADFPDPYTIRVRDGIEAGSIVLDDGSVLPPAAFGGDATRPAAPAPPPARDPVPTTLVFLGLSALLVGAALLVRGTSRANAWRRAVVELAELRDVPATGAVEERRAELRERAHALRPR